MLRDKLKSFWGRVSPGLLGLTLFIAFWQFRHPIYSAFIGGRYFEYESFNLYAADILALLFVVGALVWGLRTVRIEKAVMGWGVAVLSWNTLSILWADATLPAVVRAAEFWLWALFAYFVTKMILKAAGWIVGGIIVSGGVGIAHYLANHSLGLHLFGESVLKPEEVGMPVVIKEGGRQLRASGLTPHPNILGGVIVWGGHWLWLRGAELSRSLGVYVVISALLSVVLILSWTRSAWIAAGATSLIVAVWAWKNGLKKILWMIGVGWLVAAVMLVSQPEIARGRLWLGEPVRLEQYSVEDRVASIEGWKEVMQGNWLVGVGTGNYSTALARLHPDWPEWDVYPVHNIYLLWVAELGLVGLLLGLGFLFAVIRHIRLRGVGILNVMPLIAWLIMGLFDHWPLSIHQGYVGLFLALALIFAEGDVS